MCPWLLQLGCARYSLQTPDDQRKDSSSVHVQRMAAAIVAESGGHVSTQTRTLSQLGTSGKHPANTARDLERRVGKRSALWVQKYLVRLPVKGKHGQEVHVLWPMLAPHEMFAKLHELGYMNRVHADRNPAEFWDAARNEDWARAHPVYEQDLRNYLPIRIHGDDGKYSKERSVCIWNWSGVFPHGDAQDTRFLITVVPTHIFWCEGKVNKTLEAVTSFLTWSINVMFAGVWPEEGFAAASLNGERLLKAGGPLAGNWRAAFAGFKSDWKFEKEVFMQTRCWRARLVCPNCLASSQGENLYTDPDGNWRNTTFNHADLAAEPDPRSPLEGILGFHHDLVYVDVMHVLFLGIGRDLVRPCSCRVFG